MAATSHICGTIFRTTLSQIVSDSSPLNSALSLIMPTFYLANIHQCNYVNVWWNAMKYINVSMVTATWSAHVRLALFPGCVGGGKNWPGIDCLCMCDHTIPRIFL